MRHPWPGNVRELENTLVRAAVLARGRTLIAGRPRRSPAHARAPALAGRCAETPSGRLAALVNDADRPGKDLHAAVVAAVERPLIELVLERTGGNQLRAADLLGINRNTLRKKITELGIPIRARRRARDPLALPPLYAIVDPLDTGRDPARRSRAACSPAARACSSSA